MRKVQTNCPNCGAVMDSDKCQFCGTILYDFACLDADQPFYMKIKLNNEIFRVKAKMTVLKVRHYFDELPDILRYADVKPIMITRAEHINIKAEFEAIQEKGVLFMAIDTDQVDPDDRPY